jgi:hypothetical protein
MPLDLFENSECLAKPRTFVFSTVILGFSFILACFPGYDRTIHKVKSNVHTHSLTIESGDRKLCSSFLYHSLAGRKFCVRL